jgi:hypothetical protein
LSWETRRQRALVWGLWSCNSGSLSLSLCEYICGWTALPIAGIYVQNNKLINELLKGSLYR